MAAKENQRMKATALTHFYSLDTAHTTQSRISQGTSPSRSLTRKTRVFISIKAGLKNVNSNTQSGDWLFEIWSAKTEKRMGLRTINKCWQACDKGIHLHRNSHLLCKPQLYHSTLPRCWHLCWWCLCRFLELPWHFLPENKTHDSEWVISRRTAKKILFPKVTEFTANIGPAVLFLLSWQASFRGWVGNQRGQHSWASGLWYQSIAGGGVAHMYKPDDHTFAWQWHLWPFALCV